MRWFIPCVVSTLIASAPAVAETSDARATLCALAPTFTVCTEDPGPLNAAAARGRLDAEFARISEQSDTAALDFALKSFAFAGLNHRDKAYRELKERALVAAYAAPAKPDHPNQVSHGNTGDRYFAFETIGFVANAAGDKRGALEMVRERLPLIRNLKEGEYWTQYYADVGSATSKEQAYERVARDAVAFGDPALARSIIEEGFGGKKESEFDYYTQLARLEIHIGHYSDAETAARVAVSKAPNVFCKDEKRKRPAVEVAHLSLIEALARQGKTFDPELKKFRDILGAECTYLSGHATKLFQAAESFAEFAPDTARVLLLDARLIFSIDDGGGDVFSKFYFESSACKALGDRKCLLDIAQAQESAVDPDQPYEFAIPVWAYLDAKDYVSARRLILKASVETEQGKLCSGLDRSRAISEFIEDKDFANAHSWLTEWFDCAKSMPSNWQTGFGEGGNIWVDFASAYSHLSLAEADAGDDASAKRDAEIGFLFAIEAANTWKLEYLGYRADNLGRAYGSAFGALTALERNRRRQPK